MTKDMTKGNPIKLILFFSIPLLIGNLFQQFYNMVDAMVVGRFVNSFALGGVGATSSIMFVTLGFSLGLTIGFSVVISQRFGAGDQDGVRKAIAMSVYLSLIVSGILTTVGSFFARDILVMLNTPEDLIEYSVQYLQMIFLGSAGLVFYNLCSSVLRAVGDSKTPLYFLVLASFLNVALDLLFVVVLPLETMGVGLATALAQGISAIACVIYTYKKQPNLRLHKQDWEWDKDTVNHLIKLGIPLAFQTSVTGIGVLIMQVAVNGFGPIVVAGYTTATKIQQLAIQPLISVGTSLATYSGQNLGAEKYKRIRNGVMQGALLVIVASITGTVICHLFGEKLAEMFVGASEVDVISFSQQYLKLTSLFYIPLGLLFVYRSSLQGVGNTTIPMLSGFLELILRTVVIMILPNLMGFDGITYADVVSWLGAALFLIVGYFYQLSKFPKEDMGVD